MHAFKRVPSVFQVLAVLALLSATVVYAEPPAPPPYTSSTQLGFERQSIQRDLYTAAARLVEAAKKVIDFTPAEEECAKVTAAERFLEETKKALEGTILGPHTLGGHEQASENLRRMNDQWCNEQGGGAGATKIAKALGQARSVVRPFIQGRLDELKEIANGRPPTAGEAAAVAAAAIAAFVTAPVWAF